MFGRRSARPALLLCAALLLLPGVLCASRSSRNATVHRFHGHGVAPVSGGSDARGQATRTESVLFLASWSDYSTRMDRFYYDFIDAAIRQHGAPGVVTVWGPGFEGWEANASGTANMDRLCGAHAFHLAFSLSDDYGFRHSSCVQNTTFVYEVGDCHNMEDAATNCRFTVPHSAHVVAVRYAHLLITQFYEPPPHVVGLPPKLYTHLPDCANPTGTAAEVLNATRGVTMLLIGSRWEFLYPLRHAAFAAHEAGLLLNRSVVYEHPGYSLDHGLAPASPTGPGHSYAVHPTAQQGAYSAALRNASICVFDSSKIRKAIRKFFEAALEGCVIASDLPLDNWAEFRGAIIELPLTASPQEVAAILLAAASDPDRLAVLRHSAHWLVRSRYTCAHKLDSMLRAYDLYQEGRRGFYFPHSMALDCHNYLSSWTLSFCQVGGTWNGTLPAQKELHLRNPALTAAAAAASVAKAVFTRPPGCMPSPNATVEQLIDTCFAGVKALVAITCDASLAATVAHTIGTWTRLGRPSHEFLAVCTDAACFDALLAKGLVVYHLTVPPLAYADRVSHIGRARFGILDAVLAAGISVLQVDADVYLTGLDDPLHYMRTHADPSWDIQAQKNFLTCASNATAADGGCLFDANIGIVYFRASSNTRSFLRSFQARVGTRWDQEVFNELLQQPQQPPLPVQVAFLHERFFGQVMWDMELMYLPPAAARARLPPHALMVHLTCVQPSLKDFYAKQWGLQPDAVLDRMYLSWAPTEGTIWTLDRLAMRIASLVTLASVEKRALVPFPPIVVDPNQTLPFQSVVNLRAVQALGVAVASPNWLPVAEYSLHRVKTVTDTDGSLGDWLATSPVYEAAAKAHLLCASLHAFLNTWGDCKEQCKEDTS